MSLRKLAATALLSGATACAHQAENAPPERAASTVPAGIAPRAADVGSPDAIIAAAYEVISGPAGKARDWDRFRSLFTPGARLIPTERNEAGTGFSVNVHTTEEFVTLATAFFAKEGFYERGIARRMDRYGYIVQVFSTYESRHSPNEEPFARGINSFQAFFDGTRWWLVTIFWQAESADFPIPKEFLPAGH
jgi:hypothetical protein